MNVYLKGFEIDADVFKAIVARRTSDDMTPNDVIRDALGLNTPQPAEPVGAPRLQRTRPLPARGLVGCGVFFPHGTEFRARYKGHLYFGRIEDGNLMVDGKSYGSPSGAATDMTGTSINGWLFWECLFPDSDTWRPINSLRKRR